VVHVGIILNLAMTGFWVRKWFPVGSFQVQNIVDAGPGQRQIPKDWFLRVNRFWIDYTPTGGSTSFTLIFPF